MANQGETGTGKHPHKKTSEPFEHHGKAGCEGGHQAKGGSKSGSKEEGGRSGQQARSGQEQQGGDDLKAREYTDAEGNVHHHTNLHGTAQGQVNAEIGVMRRSH